MNFDSFEYWKNRYALGPNFQQGYDEGIKITAIEINDFIKEKNIKRLFDYGCGDGRQSKHIIVDDYLGVDISETAICRCRNLNPGRKYYLAKKNDKVLKSLLKDFKPDLSLSLWCISHLIEDEIFKEYMENLFYSERFVLIHSLNEDKYFDEKYSRHRNFTKYISDNFKDWKLIYDNKRKYLYEKVINLS